MNLNHLLEPWGLNSHDSWGKKLTTQTRSHFCTELLHGGTFGLEPCHQCGTWKPCHIFSTHGDGWRHVACTNAQSIKKSWFKSLNIKNMIWHSVTWSKTTKTTVWHALAIWKSGYVANIFDVRCPPYEPPKWIGPALYHKVRLASSVFGGEDDFRTQILTASRDRGSNDICKVPVDVSLPELFAGKICRKPVYFGVKTLVSYRFSLKSAHWFESHRHAPLSKRISSKIGRPMSSLLWAEVCAV